MPKQLLCVACSVLAILIPVCRAANSAEPTPKSYPILSGVGLALKASDGHIYVTKIVPKSPAEKSGKIPEGARLVSIESEGKTTSFDGKTIGEAASLIRGPVGTKLVLTVQPRPGEDNIRVTLKRDALELPGLVPDSTYESFIGKPAPDLELKSLKDRSKQRLSDYRGKIVVLDFWASWCATCYPPVTELQKLVKKHPQWDEKVVLASVTVDSDLAAAVEVIKKQEWDRTQNFSTGLESLEAAGISVIPLIMIVAPNGTITTMAGAHALDVEKEVTALLAK